MMNVPQQNFDFSEVAEFSLRFSKLKIRCGNMWATTVDKKLFFAKIYTYDRPKIMIVKGIENVESLFVSPDGEYCLCKVNSMAYYVNSIDLIPYSIHLTDCNRINAVSWLKRQGTTTVFLITNGEALYVINVSQSNAQTQIIPTSDVFKGIQGKPVGLLVLNLPKTDKIGLIIITEAQVVPFILDHNYIFERTKNKRSFNIPGLRTDVINPLVTEGNMIGVWVTNKQIFGFVLNENASKPGDIISNQFFFNIPANTIWFTINDGLVFTMDMNLRIYYHYDSNLYQISDFPVDIPSIIADIDPLTKDIYLLRSNGVTRYSFPGSNHTSESFFNMLYSKSFDLQNIKLSLHLFKYSHKSLQSHLSHYNNIQSIEILQLLISDLKSSYIIMQTQQKLIVSIAYRCLEFAIRAYAQENYKESEKIINSLLSEEFITRSGIKDLCIQYGVIDFAFNFMTLKEKLDLWYSRGEYDKVIEHLDKITDIDVITDYILSLLPYDEEKIKKVVANLKSWNNEKLCIILSSPIFEEIVANAPIEKICTESLRYLYAEYNAKRGNLEFLQNRQFSKELKNTIIRSLSAQKRYKELSDGLFQANQYTESVLAAHESSIDDCVKAIIRIPERGRKRQNVLKAVLSTISKEDANAICMQLLKQNCLDQMTALEYLPDNSKVSDLSAAMQKYIRVNCQDAEHINKEVNIAKRSMRRAKVINKKPSNNYDVSRFDICPICKKNLIQQPFSIFPCGHKFHTSCLKSKECHECGQIAINNIDKEFDGNLTGWSMILDE